MMDISEITNYLLVGAQPQVDDIKELVGHKIELIISVLDGRPAAVFGEPPLRSLWLPAYDTFLTPIPLGHLTRGVQAAQEVIQKGGRVFVHCYKGRHRSVIMAAAILIAHGYTASEATALLRKQRTVADPDAWYVRLQIRRFERHWRAKNKN